MLVEASKKLGALSIFEVNERLTSHLNQTQELKHQLDDLKNQMSNSLVTSIIKEVVEVNGVKYIFKKFDNLDRDLLSKLAEAIKIRLPESLSYLINVQGDKISLIATAGEKAIKRGVNCGQIIKDTSTLLGGKGGGKPEQAQAGAKDLNNLSQVIDYINKYLKELK
jgi:alanyl-tRNA synthetase